MGFSVGNMIGGALDFASAEYFRDKQSDELSSNRQFNADESQRNRDFQERMRGTQYQTTVRDLEAAGLNPALAYQHGGAGTPAGSMGSVSGTTSGDGPRPTESMQRQAQTDVSAAQVELMAAQARREDAETERLRGTSLPSMVEMDKLRQDVRESIERMGTLRAQAESHWWSAAASEQSIKNMKEEVPRIRETVHQLRSLQNLQGTQANLTFAQMDEVKQRVAQNLPAIEAALKKYESALKGMEIPQAYTRSAVYQNQVTGALAELLRAFNPLAGILGR